MQNLTGFLKNQTKNKVLKVKKNTLLFSNSTAQTLLSENTSDRNHKFRIPPIPIVYIVHQAGRSFAG